MVRRKGRSRWAKRLALTMLVLSACGTGDDDAGEGDGAAPGSDAVSTSSQITSPGTGPASLPPRADPAAPAPEPVTETRTLAFDGRDRTYRLHVPPGLPVGDDVPLLVALHGGGLGSADQFASNSGFEGVADDAGFIVVFPNGVGVPPDDALRTWNGGRCCGPAMNQGSDDVAFLVAVVEDVAATYPIDPDRVYAAGHSNGGIMSYRLACEAADTFAAIGVFAGTMEVDDCDPTSPVSVLHIHGDADENLPVDGGRGPKSITPADFRFTSPRRAVDAWVELDGCPGEPRVSAIPEVDIRTWGPCSDGAEVQFQVIAGGEHAWAGSEPGGPGVAFVGEPSQALDASRVIWDFLARHGRSR